MSNGYWRTARLQEPFNPGKCATERVSEYVQTWKRRCYFDDIPDEVPAKVAASGRAPSYKAIAIALLQNDMHLYRLGFTKPAYEKQQKALQFGRLLACGIPPDNVQLTLF